MNIESIKYDNHENTLVKITYDTTQVKYGVPVEDDEVSLWVAEGNIIGECPYGDYATKGDPNNTPNTNPIVE
jgi:hypothetical protein